MLPGERPNYQPPMLETVKRLLGIGKKATGIKLVISCEKLEKRVALLENNRLEEYTIERETDRAHDDSHAFGHFEFAQDFA
jgi:hypothetical protein